MDVRVQKTQARFKRIRVSGGPDEGIGEFFFLVDVKAKDTDLYIPLSIASSKKPTGFVYQIEGTGKGEIATTTISCNGAGVTRVLLGTIEYAKVPMGKTATFRILVEMRGRAGKEYGITISRMNYKYSPGEARYQKFESALHSKVITFW